MREKVVIIGGGVAGLTAAHELIERDFEVHLYERREFYGGKAASTRSKANLPCEHGFRFYPAWYRHLPDTMRRIPYLGRRSYHEASTVLDNLISIDAELLVWRGRDPVKLLTRLPKSLEQAKAMRSFLAEFAKLGLAPGELAFFMQRMAQFLMTPDAQRAELWEGITWWDYLGAEDKSPAFRDLISATTRLMVAAKATEASAYSIGRLALRTFSDALASVDRVLAGPTSELWIDPWVEHLRGLGVQFHEGFELSSIAFEEGGPGAARHATSELKRIDSVSLSRVAVQQVTRLRRLLPAVIWAAAGLLDSAAPSDEPELAQRRLLLRSELLRYARDADLLIGAILDDSFWQNAPLETQDPAELAVLEDTRELLPVLRLALARLAELFAPSEDAPGAAAPRGKRAGGFMATWTELVSEQTARARQRKKRDPSGRRREVLTGWRAALGAARKLSELSLDIPARLRGAAGAPIPLAEEPLAGALSLAIGSGLGAAAGALRLFETTQFAEGQRVKADHFVFALPLEQMAYYVNRCTPMHQYDPSLRRLIQLSEYMSWMSGIQFYLKEPFSLVAGHIVCMDSSWGLTAIEETQFWRETDLSHSVPGVKSEVRAVLSVDIAAWDRKGCFVAKEAFNCSEDEIAMEVWNELKTAVARQSTAQRLRDDMLLGPPTFGGAPRLSRGVNYNIDESIADVYDRKKQAAYENARSVAFSADELIERQHRSGAASQLPYIWGARRQFNVEPLLVNRVGSLALRPEAKTAIPNMFLAGDYVRTETDLACMEGANEAARRAVNALLDATSSKHERCQLWPLSIARDTFERVAQLLRFGETWQVGRQTARAVGEVTDAVMGFAGQALSTLRASGRNHGS